MGETMSKREMIEVSPPGDFIRNLLEDRGWSQTDLATILGRPIQMVNEIIAAKKAITPETAIDLGAAFGMDAEVFLNLETAYRLSLAKKESVAISRRAKLYAKVPVRELIKRGWIADSKDLSSLESNVCAFLSIDNIDEEPKCLFNARKADSYSLFTPGQIAWLCRCRQLAQKQQLSVRFNDKTFRDAIQKLPRDCADERNVKRVPEQLAHLGVQLVVLEHLPSTKIDGAAFWIGSTPVVALSVRFDRVDSFWYTLMHELAHLALHGQSFSSLDVELVGPDAGRATEKPKIEQEADTQACEWLVPLRELGRFIATTKPYYSHQKIVQFAERIGVHPGIVVGQLQYRGEIGWGHSRQFLVKIRHYLPVES